MSKSITCPLCGGHFIEKEPMKKDMTVKEAKAKRLRDQGFSIRQIQKMMKYKSPRSVQVLLEK